MKTRASLVVLVVGGLGGLLASSVSCVNNPAKSALPAQPAGAQLKSVASSPPPFRPAYAPAQSEAEKEQPTAGQADSVSAAKLPPALIASEAAEKARRDHILPARDPFLVATPPPSLRAETKTSAPAPGYVWMPGHWAPVKGEWQWKPGEWGVPATPSSVWIEPKYDSKTTHWSAGYWQPDRAGSYEPEAPQKDPPSSAKF